MEFYSHPGVLLKDHLSAVGKLSSEFINSLNIKNKGELSNVAAIIGYSHDFGKYSSFFQNYLLHNKDLGAKSHHSLLSALFGAWQMQNYMDKYSYTNQKIKKFLPLITYLVIHRHHGDLRSPEEIIPLKKFLSDYPQMSQVEPGLKMEIQALQYQIRDLRIEPRFSAVVREMEEIGICGIKDFLTKDRILEIFRSLDSLRYEFIENDELSESDRLELYFLSLLLFSSLIDADKRLAAKVSQIQRQNIPADIVDSYIEKEFGNKVIDEMNKMRNEVYKVVIKNVTNLPLSNQILTLTAPTGSGKTLTALSATLKLRERIKKERNYKPRIIYCLPFINIIEQNYEVFYKVLLRICDFKGNESQYIIKHHHLADLEYKTGNENKPLDEALLLVESWESEIIVTTFVQFLHTIIGFKNSFLKKMHNIAGSIIILDEIQNIPIEYWELTGKVLNGLTEILGCTIIQMTATRPLIFYERETVELVDNYKSYFEKLNRVVLKPSLEEISQEEFVDWFVKRYSEQKSYLIVVNTIPISISIYNLLKNKLEEKILGFVEFDKDNKEITNEDLTEKFLRVTKRPIIYLSTNIIPRQRKRRIEFLKDFLSKNRGAILVSTQVVEAGVDLDFQEVIRDIGPLDSIIQVAGRCNRNNGPQKGEVRVINLTGGGGASVYGKVHPFIASILLKDHKKIQEKEFYNLVECYYPKVKDRTSDTTSENIWKAIIKLRFHHDHLTSISHFQVIKEKGEFFEIFVEIDTEAQKIRENFLKEVLNEKEFQKRQKSFLGLRKSFNEHLLSIRKERVKDNVPPKIEKSEMFFIPFQQLSEFYDLETGFKTEQGSLRRF